MQWPRFMRRPLNLISVPTIVEVLPLSKPGFAFGTIEILNMCIETDALTIIGGGHTSALVSSRGVASKVTHNSTGGGSTMCLLSGQEMPVIDSLIDSASKFSKMN